jgi:hypothetical protein
MCSIKRKSTLKSQFCGSRLITIVQSGRRKTFFTSGSANLAGCWCRWPLADDHKSETKRCLWMKRHHRFEQSEFGPLFLSEHSREIIRHKLFFKPNDFPPLFHVVLSMLGVRSRRGSISRWNQILGLVESRSGSPWRSKCFLSSQAFGSLPTISLSYSFLDLRSGNPHLGKPSFRIRFSRSVTFVHDKLWQACQSSITQSWLFKVPMKSWNLDTSHFSRFISWPRIRNKSNKGI